MLTVTARASRPTKSATPTVRLVERAPEPPFELSTMVKSSGPLASVVRRTAGHGAAWGTGPVGACHAPSHATNPLATTTVATEADEPMARRRSATAVIMPEAVAAATNRPVPTCLPGPGVLQWRRCPGRTATRGRTRPDRLRAASRLQSLDEDDWSRSGDGGRVCGW